MNNTVSFIGFGEAAQAFSSDKGWAVTARGYDIKCENANLRPEKVQDFEKCSVEYCDSHQSVFQKGTSLVSLVTADQALEVVKQAAPMLNPGSTWFDMNSVSPSTKREAASIVEGRGADYIDVAIMSPVHPKRLNSPLLVSGKKAAKARDQLMSFGFTEVNVVGNRVGKASSIKMLRSVMIKGIEALTAECVLGAYNAGVLEEVLSSLGEEWPEKANYNLERMMVHGRRRAAEMREVEKTLSELGVEPLLTRGVIQRQQEMGDMAINDVAETLWRKMVQLVTRKIELEET